MRKILSNSEKRDINSNLSSFNLSVSKKDKVESEDNLISVNGKLMFFISDNIYLPTLRTIIENNISFSKVVVDMGAVKFVASGADIMRPGIVSFDDFQKDAFVLIVDEKHGKPLAIGKALFSSEELKGIDKGKVIKSIHYVGDIVWNS